MVLRNFREKFQNHESFLTYLGKKIMKKKKRSEF